MPGEAGLAEPGRIRFEDVTKKAGIDFHYFQSPDTATPGARMFENTGGGVAVLDFDRDGWPDLYFTQGCRWPMDRLETDPDPSKCFWIGCTAITATGHSAMSHARRAGATNASARALPWATLTTMGGLIFTWANIGDNRLYRNNGDGTFDEWPIGGNASSGPWTTSCVVAHIDGDGHVDLYDVNYLSGPGVFTKICPGAGRSICLPPERI
ncbi:MAG: hypothetical protein CM1200mP2_23490 [Planctomycetaceae bacterium]|nr:MAG: hypothetical protein CM1200mP2_23490 [Planctomycetaceae bacterium]